MFISFTPNYDTWDKNEWFYGVENERVVMRSKMFCITITREIEISFTLNNNCIDELRKRYRKAGNDEDLLRRMHNNMYKLQYHIGIGKNNNLIRKNEFGLLARDKNVEIMFYSCHVLDFNERILFKFEMDSIIYWRTDERDQTLSYERLGLFNALNIDTEKYSHVAFSTIYDRLKYSDDCKNLLLFNPVELYHYSRAFRVHCHLWSLDDAKDNKIISDQKLYEKYTNVYGTEYPSGRRFQVGLRYYISAEDLYELLIENGLLVEPDENELLFEVGKAVRQNNNYMDMYMDDEFKLAYEEFKIVIKKHGYLNKWDAYMTYFTVVDCGRRFAKTKSARNNSLICND